MAATAAEALIVAAEFAFGGRILSAAPYGSGHINDTFLTLVEAAGGPRRFILQRINHQVFKQPDQLMENVARVCAHAHAKLGAAGGWQPGLLAVFLQGRPTDALGLGDAVFPAVLSGWALRRDRYRAAQGARSTLFQAALAGYCGGCFLCEVFNSGAGQPALLFLSPATLVPVLGAAAASGDLGPAWTWPGDSADRANGAAQNGEETREDSGGGGGPG